MRLNRSVVRWVSRGAVVGPRARRRRVGGAAGRSKRRSSSPGSTRRYRFRAYLQTVVITVHLDGRRSVTTSTFPVYDWPTARSCVLPPRPSASSKEPRTERVTDHSRRVHRPGRPPTTAHSRARIPMSAPRRSRLPANGGGARILRRSTQPYVDGQILYVPMPLHYSCYNVDCGLAPSDCEPNCADDICTCKAGVCVPGGTRPDHAPPATTTRSSTARRTRASARSRTRDPDDRQLKQPGCMDYEITPQPIGDPSDCIFATARDDRRRAAAGAGPYAEPRLPAAASRRRPRPGGGLNVRAVFDNSVSEVLDYEGICPSTWPPAPGVNPQEGYCNYADAPQKFRLAPGLCAQFLGQSTSHQITLLEAAAQRARRRRSFSRSATTRSRALRSRTSSTAASRPRWRTASAPSRSRSTPANSALYILFDKSSGMRDFLGPQALGRSSACR